MPTHRPRPRLAARAGATGSSRLRDWASRDVRASPTPTSGSPPRVTARAAPHRTPAWRDPPPTQRGEARAAVGKERRSAPTAGPAQALPRGRGPLLPTCSGSGHRGHCTLGRGSGWGVRYPKAPSRIAREGFSHRGCVIPHPSSLPFGPTEALHKPPSPRPAVGGAGGVCGMGKHTARVRLPHPKRTHTRSQVGGGSTRGVGPATVSPPTAHRGRTTATRRQAPVPPTEGEKPEASPRPLPSRPPTKRATHGDTPPRRRPRGARWEKGMTPPLGLGHLRDDLERSRGTREDQASHAHAPAAGARRSGGTAPHRRGGDRSRGTRQGGEARASAASEDHGPAHAARRGGGRPQVRAGDHHPCLPHTRRQAGRA